MINIIVSYNIVNTPNVSSLFKLVGLMLHYTFTGSRPRRETSRLAAPSGDWDCPKLGYERRVYSTTVSVCNSNVTTMSDLLTVAPKFTRPACRAAAAAIDRYLLPAPGLISKPVGRRCCCRSTGQTDGHLTVLLRLNRILCGRRNKLGRCRESAAML